MEKEKTMKIAVNLDCHDAGLLYKALLAHDGQSLAPQFSRADQALLTRALDCLRSELLDCVEKGSPGC